MYRQGYVGYCSVRQPSAQYNWGNLILGAIINLHGARGKAEIDLATGNFSRLHDDADKVWILSTGSFVKPTNKYKIHK